MSRFDYFNDDESFDEGMPPKPCVSRTHDRLGMGSLYVVLLGLVFLAVVQIVNDVSRSAKPAEPPVIQADLAAPVTAQAARARKVPGLPAQCRFVVKAVIDGDTVRGDIYLPWGICLADRDVRLLGYDAPETSRRRRSVDVTDAEIEAGERAKATLEQLVAEAKGAILAYDPAQEVDPFGRLLGGLYLERDGKDGPIDVAGYMKGRKLVRGD